MNQPNVDYYAAIRPIKQHDVNAAAKGNISLHDEQNHVLFDSIRVISEENDNLDLSQLEQESNNLMESIIKMDNKNRERQQSQEQLRLSGRSPNSLLRHSNQGLQSISLSGMCGFLDSSPKKLGSGNQVPPIKLPKLATTAVTSDKNQRKSDRQSSPTMKKVREGAAAKECKGTVYEVRGASGS